MYIESFFIHSLKIPQQEAPREDKPQQGGIKIKKKLGQKGATESKVERGVVETKDTTSSSGAVAGTSQNEVNIRLNRRISSELG